MPSWETVSSPVSVAMQWTGGEFSGKWHNEHEVAGPQIDIERDIHHVRANDRENLIEEWTWEVHKGRAMGYVKVCKPSS